jgi:D-alanine-D-alanine ligase
MKKILVSACLAGIPCRYDGKSQPHPVIVRWVKQGIAVPVCPECEGGLKVPRTPCEIIVADGNQKVYNEDHKDLTEAYEAGARAALKLARENGCTRAVLKAKSPSCGCGQIYDGTFTHTLKEGNGVTTALLLKKGLAVSTEAALADQDEEDFMSEKIKLGVVFGGQSGEHEVARMSAYNVLSVIDQDKYEITTIGITKDGRWLIYSGDWDKLPDGSWQDDTDHLRSDFSIFTDPAITDIDIFFPIMHGPMGEDGTIQGVFEMMGKPYVGCGVLASSVGMDKVISKIVFESAGIPIVPYVYFYKRDWEKRSEELVNQVETELQYPVFIKPVNMGSSVGITKAHNAKEFVAGVNHALNYDSKILVETGIDGREIECAVLEENGEITTAIPGEIKASKEFYDYEAKYAEDQHSEIVIPANLSDEILNRIRAYAVKAFAAIDGSGLTRVDFFVDHHTYAIYINEVNTLPGFTNISMYPKMWENMGMSYADLVEKIIQTAARKKVTAYTLQ